MIRQAIVLAGGQGTRLRSEVPDLPKCLAPVAGKPFLEYLVNHCREQGIERFVFALGYKHQLVEDYISNTLAKDQYTFSVETAPLGTGGALLLACTKSSDENVLVLNADSYFGMSVSLLAATHEERRADCTVALKPMRDFDRYGVVKIDDENRITEFQEKQPTREGLINTGVYVLNRKTFGGLGWTDRFSFEKDFLDAYLTKLRLFGQVSAEYFIDIGVPDDYQLAQTELPKRIH